MPDPNASAFPTASPAAEEERFPEHNEMRSRKMGNEVDTASLLTLADTLSVLLRALLMTEDG
jgi:hypothetical protein